MSIKTLIGCCSIDINLRKNCYEISMRFFTTLTKLNFRRRVIFIRKLFFDWWNYLENQNIHRSQRNKFSFYETIKSNKQDSRSWFVSNTLKSANDYLSRRFPHTPPRFYQQHVRIPSNHDEFTIEKIKERWKCSEIKSRRTTTRQARVS